MKEIITEVLPAKDERKKRKRPRIKKARLVIPTMKISELIKRINNLKPKP